MGYGTQERRQHGSLYLPRGHHAGLGSQEEVARRRDAEDGSRRLLEAIQRYLERRRG